MALEPLTPAMKRTLGEINGRCDECMGKLRMARELGYPAEELENRVVHQKAIVQAALDLNDQLASGDQPP